MSAIDDLIMGIQNHVADCATCRVINERIMQCRQVDFLIMGLRRHRLADAENAFHAGIAVRALRKAANVDGWIDAHVTFKRSDNDFGDL